MSWRNCWVTAHMGRPASTSENSLPPEPGWSGVLPFLTRRIARSVGDCPDDPYATMLANLGADLGISGVYRSSTVAAGRGVIGGPPAQARRYASYRASLGDLGGVDHRLA